MSAGPRLGLDTRWIRRSFDRASATYDASAVLQREVRSLLLERLELTALEPRVVLDAGAGTGQGAQDPEGPLPQGPGARGGLRPGNAARRGRPALVVSAVLRARRGRGASAARRRQRRSGAQQFHAALVRARRGVRGISPRARPARSS